MKLFKKADEAAPQEAHDARPAPALSPYMAARREWNERYGDHVKSAHHWRVAALGAIGIAVLSVGGLIAVSMQSKVVPYAVEINGHGEVTRVQRADVLREPNANQTRAALRSWVLGARTVYTDPAALKNLIDQTYAETLPDSPAYQVLAEYHRDNNPYQRAANETVSVDVRAAVPVSANTWQIEWTETTRQASGKVVSAEEWQANLTIAVSAPTNEAQVMLNPTGVYVRQFSWTRRLQNR